MIVARLDFATRGPRSSETVKRDEVSQSREKLHRLETNHRDSIHR